jgi:hypothetical protein
MKHNSYLHRIEDRLIQMLLYSKGLAPECWNRAIGRAASAAIPLDGIIGTMAKGTVVPETITEILESITPQLRER